MIIPQLGYGGAESSFLRLAKFLSNYYQVTIGLMTLSYGNESYTNINLDIELPIIFLDNQEKLNLIFPSKLLRWWGMLQKLKNVKSSYDLTISFLSGTNLLNALSGSTSKTIISERGSKLYHTGITRWQKFLWLRVLDPFIYRRVDKIVAASVDYMQEIIQIGGKTITSKVISIEGGIDLDNLISQINSEPDEDIAKFCNQSTAIYCGRLDNGKGIDLLLPVFSNICKIYPDARFLIIGDGPLKKTIIERCEKIGLSITTSGDPRASVFLAGYRSNPIRHFRLGNVFLMPSLHEGLCNALIEALLTGIPILSSDYRWGARSILAKESDLKNLPKEPVKKTKTVAYGTLMPLPVTPQALDIWSSEILRYLEHPPMRRNIDECYLIASKFDIDRVGLQWVKLINSLIKHQN
ncbi:glycosyltransferase [Thermosynechococcus sichuanensis]|nr:glycosyltransferase [Thermosynechococcus vestitus]